MQRDHLIDAARAASVLAVVVYHALFFVVRLDDGALSLTRWQPTGPLLVVFWVALVLPVFFIASGFGHAASAERAAARTDPAARLALRVARIAGPLVLFVAALATVSTAAAWLPGAAPPLPYPGVGGLSWRELAAAVSGDYADFLWFLTTYLVLVVLAPTMVRLHARWGLRVVGVLGLAAATADLLAAVAAPGWRAANWVIVWLACHQLGVVLQRGWLRRGPAWQPWAAVATGAAGVVALIALAGYPASPIPNYYPPTLALLALALAQAGALALLGRAGVLRRFSPGAERRLAVLNAHLLTIYLWQAACIIVAILLLVRLGRALPAAAGWLVGAPAILVVSVAVLAAVVPWIARLERRIVAALAPSPHARMSRAAVGAAVALLLAGTTLVWQHGAVVHPAYPWSTAGVLLVLLAIAALRAATRRAVTSRGAPGS